MKNTSRSRFILTRQKQDGQVAVFVALIFQIIFIFFALLINVGLLIHHKINLQHSTDLAAYYGAMKQAEQMNAIAHINFQIRQSWKLLTWRYRILGTFGFISTGQPFNQNYPFQSITVGNARQFVFNGTRGDVATTNSPFTNGTPQMQCNRNGPFPPGRTIQDYLVNGVMIGIQDIPFFCVGHDGFTSWTQAETNCRFDCSMFKDAGVIRRLPTPNTPPILGNNPGIGVNDLVRNVNSNLEERCNQLGKVGASVLAKFLLAYIKDSNNRNETIKMLAANLSQDADRMVDLDGKSIKLGSERTFKNNLTGANFTGLSNTGFQVYNGLNSQKCKFRNGSSDSTEVEFLKKVDFALINYFIHTCTYNASANPNNAGSNYLPAAVYTENGLADIFRNNLSQPEQDVLLSFFQPNNRHFVGYEKNPHCVEYFGAKATSEPNIPFLPLSKIKLEAVAFAKPFGGSIGPSYGMDWPKESPKSVFDDSRPETKVDSALPMRDATEGSSNSDITKSVYAQPNFSLHIGDKLGLRNLDYISTYHSILAVRDIASYDNKNFDNNINTLGTTRNSGAWPDYSNWNNIDTPNPDNRQYDILATSNSPAAGTRAAEITAIAPNQFDIYYYSIDPDFYNNYYVRMYNAFDQIKQAAGNNVALNRNDLRADFGAVGMDGSPSNAPLLTEKSFSVKDQIYLKNTVLNVAPRTPPSHNVAGSGNSRIYHRLLNYLVSFQTSFLTGWTFLSFTDYTTFPSAEVNQDENTMSFGQCADAWNESDSFTDADRTNADKFRTPLSLDPDNPPTPGNCVTGGRTGYSVKLVSPALLLDQSKLENPLDPSFLNF